MNHRIKTIAIAATASALTVAGMAAAHGNGGGGHSGWSPFASSGGKALTYSETHLRKHGEDVTIRLDQGRVAAASANAISITRNDGETVEVPVDDDTRFIGGWRKHDVSASHHGDDDGDDRDDANLPEGKRVSILRSDDDPAAEAVKVLHRHRWHHHRGDRDRDDD